jgi:hypothetical protein
VPVLPRVFSADVTPERLASLMQEHGGGWPSCRMKEESWNPRRSLFEWNAEPRSVAEGPFRLCGSRGSSGPHQAADYSRSASLDRRDITAAGCAAEPAGQTRIPGTRVVGAILVCVAGLPLTKRRNLKIRPFGLSRRAIPPYPALDTRGLGP